MSKHYEELTPPLRELIAAQQLFFVATAPLSADGHVNLSPKGLDTFRVLGPRRVAYLDLTGSGIETVAHLRENGRITVLFVTFSGAPKILRLYGRGTVAVAGTPSFEALAPHFAMRRGARAIIDVELSRIVDSCGYSIPTYKLVGDREQLDLWTAKRDDDELADYRRLKNTRSIDDLPGL